MTYGGDFYWGRRNSNIVPSETSGGSFPNMNSRDFGFKLVCGRRRAERGHMPVISVNEIVMNVHETRGRRSTLRRACGKPQAGSAATGMCRSPLTSPSGCARSHLVRRSVDLPGSSVSPNQSVWQQSQHAVAGRSGSTVGLSRWGQHAFPSWRGRRGPAGRASKTLMSTTRRRRWRSPGRQMRRRRPGPSTSPRPQRGPVGRGWDRVQRRRCAGAVVLGEHGAAGDQWRRRALGAVHRGEQRGGSERRAWVVGAAGFSMKIGEPTVSAVAFSAVVDKLRCRRMTEGCEFRRDGSRCESAGGSCGCARRPTRRSRSRACHRADRAATDHARGDGASSWQEGASNAARVVRVVVEPRTVFKTRPRVRMARGRRSMAGWARPTGSRWVGRRWRC